MVEEKEKLKEAVEEVKAEVDVVAEDES